MASAFLCSFANGRGIWVRPFELAKLVEVLLVLVCIRLGLFEVLDVTERQPGETVVVVFVVDFEEKGWICDVRSDFVNYEFIMIRAGGMWLCRFPPGVGVPRCFVQGGCTAQSSCTVWPYQRALKHC